MPKFLTKEQITSVANQIKTYIDTKFSKAVLFTPHTYSKEEALQARLNIGAGGNPNLLDNPFFTVNQRGQASYTAAGYSVDRWRIIGSSLTATPSSAGITLAFSATYRDFEQVFENPLQYANQTFTLSVNVSAYTSSGAIRLQAMDKDGASISYGSFNNTGIHTLTFTTDENGLGKIGIYNVLTASATLTIKSIKVELGSVSTLANDAPPNYTDELLKCISSTADTTDTYANKPIGATPNPNLLDNPWFTVNQRGFTSSTETNAVQTVDRWYINNGAGGTTSVETDGCIKLNANSGSGYISHEQRVPYDLTGKVVTVSIMLKNGTIISATGTAPTRNTSYQMFARNADVPGMELRCTATPAGVGYGITTQIVVYQGESFEIKAYKLEFGSVSTLANDVPPNYAEELAKCQRYFVRLNTPYSQVIGTAYANSATALLSQINVPVPMRTAPTFSISGTMRAIGNGQLESITATTVRGINNNSVIMTHTAANLVQNEAYVLDLTLNTYIDLSADL